MFKIITFYHFTTLVELEKLQAKIQDYCEKNKIVGTILLASEGINATVAGSIAAIDGLLILLKSQKSLSKLVDKTSYTHHQPFKRLKIKIRKEIVSLKVPGLDAVAGKRGIAVAPDKWHELIDDPNIPVIDARNVYEEKVGTFKNAISPHTHNFREFPDFVKTLNPQKTPKVAMFCTGGIRCEKASAYMLTQGFEKVYQLQGGILNYLEKVPVSQSQWQGECFVFDDRVTVDHHLHPGNFQMCFACRRPLSPEDLKHPAYEIGVSCPACVNERTIAQKQKDRVRHEQRTSSTHQKQ